MTSMYEPVANTDLARLMDGMTGPVHGGWSDGRHLSFCRDNGLAYNQNELLRKYRRLKSHG